MKKSKKKHSTPSGDPAAQPAVVVSEASECKKAAKQRLNGPAGIQASAEVLKVRKQKVKHRTKPARVEPRDKRDAGGADSYGQVAGSTALKMKDAKPKGPKHASLARDPSGGGTAAAQMNVAAVPVQAQQASANSTVIPCGTAVLKVRKMLRKKTKRKGRASFVVRNDSAATLEQLSIKAKAVITTDTRVPMLTSAKAAEGPAASTNWHALKATLAAEKAAAPKLARRPTKKNVKEESKAQPNSVGASSALTPVVAIDCEMVGVGPRGERSQLARVCLVNNEGNLLLDTFVRGKEKVTDYRTRVSGVRARNVANAPLFEHVQEQVSVLLKGRILVGHAINNDLKALQIKHPKELIRDTARYPALMKRTAAARKPQPRSLRILAEEHLGLSIQSGEHSPIDDARCALYLYHKFRKKWETALKTGKLGHVVAKRKPLAKLVPAIAMD